MSAVVGRPVGRMVVLVGLAVLVVLGPAAVGALAQDGGPAPVTAPAGGEMSALDAVILGLVEGITEFLPVSSTGHLTVTQDLLGIGTGSDRDKEAADAYAVVIQAGAILAVVVLYWQRLMSLLQGLLGRDEAGRRVLVGLLIAVVPIGIIGTRYESSIKEHLFGVGPVIFAWAVGGVVLLVLSRRTRPRASPTEPTAPPARPPVAGDARSRSTPSRPSRPPSSAPPRCWPCGRARHAAS